MVQWSAIGDAFGVYLRESKASEEAKRRGLVPSKRRGYYEDPAKPGTVVAKSTKGGQVLAIVKPKTAPKKKAAKPTKAARPTKKTEPTRARKKVPGKAAAARKKAIAQKKPTVGRRLAKKKKAQFLNDFSSASESTEGLVSSEAVINRGGKDVAVRHVVDERGNSIDVSSTRGRQAAVKLIEARHQELQPKIISAVDAALAGDNLAKKWLGELGELLALQKILQEDVEGYFLPASAAKNDLVIFSPRGEQSRDVDMWYVSVKSTKGGEEANGLGANIVDGDYTKLLEGKTMTIQGQDVPALQYAQAVQGIKGGMMRFFSEGRVGRDGVSTEGINPRLLQIKPKTTNPNKAPGGGRPGFESHAEFLRARVVNRVELAKFLKGYREQIDALGPAGVELVRDLQKRVLAKEGERRPNKFSLHDLNEWTEEHFGRSLDETGTVAVQAADTLAARYAEGEGFVDVSIGLAEDMTQRILERAVERGQIKLDENGKPTSGADQVRYLQGLRHGSRGLGDVKGGAGYLGRILNSSPTAPVADIELSIPDFIDRIGFRRRTLDVPLG